jgi:hypothetical protein
MAVDRYHGIVLRRGLVGISGVHGPYPALVVDPDGPPILPWFCREIVERIAEDCRRVWVELGGGEGVDQLEFDGEAVSVRRFDGEEWWLVDRIEPDTFGLYAWGGTEWQWDELEIVGSDLLEVATVIAPGTDSAVDALVPRGVPGGGRVTAYLALPAVERLAAALCVNAGDNPRGVTPLVQVVEGEVLVFAQIGPDGDRQVRAVEPTPEGLYELGTQLWSRDVLPR